MGVSAATITSQKLFSCTFIKYTPLILPPITADNPLAAASGQFHRQHKSMFLQFTCKFPNKKQTPPPHGVLRYKKQDSLKSFPGGRNQQSSIQENWAFRASLQTLLNSSLFIKRSFLNPINPNLMLTYVERGWEGERETRNSNLQGRRTAATQRQQLINNIPQNLIFL